LPAIELLSPKLEPRSMNSQPEETVEPQLDHGSSVTSRSPAFQFGLVAVFWSTTTLAISLAYLRVHGRESLLLGLAAICVAMLVGLTVGWMVNRPMEVGSWAIFGVIIPYTSILTSSFAGDTAYVVTWLAVGAVGGITAAVSTGGLIRRVATVAAIAWVPVGIVWLTGAYPVSLFLEAFCAAVAGAGFAVIFEVILTLESKYGLKRYVTACAIVLLSIAVSSIGSQFVKAW